MASRILWVQAKQALCEDPWLFKIGAMHCFLLVALEDGKILKVDRDSKRYYMDEANSVFQRARSIGEKVYLHGTLKINQLKTYLEQLIVKKYEILKNNCFSFVKEIVEYVGVSTKTLDKDNQTPQSNAFQEKISESVQDIERKKNVTETNTIQHGITQTYQSIPHQNRALKFLNQVWDDTYALASKYSNQAGELIERKWPIIAGALTKFVKEEFPKAVQKGLELKKVVAENFSKVMESVKLAIERGTPDAIKKVLAAAKDKLSECSIRMSQGFKSSRFGQALEDIIELVAAKASETARYIGSLCSSLFNTVATNAQKFTANYAPKLSAKVSQYCGKASATFEKFSTKVTPVIKNIKDKVANNLPLVLSLTSNIIQEGRDLYHNKDRTWKDSVKAVCNVGVRTAVDVAVYKGAASAGAFVGAKLGAVFGGPIGAAVGGVTGFVLSLAGGILLPNYVKQSKWLPWNWF